MSSETAAERYHQAKTIATAALDLRSDERVAWIDASCGTDRALRKEVLWLIEAAEDSTVDQVPEQFQAVAQRALKQVSLEVPLPRNYRLIQRLNEGGMGVVYLAERNDGDIKQRVAFKLLQLTETPDEVLARRFATERQILSRLNHPNIAHLIDGGLTAEGRPFLATEYVEGGQIDAWCAQNQCSTELRLKLFLKVCNAVDYAHRHMVIHRDIKPSNILVTPEGEPKLLDFGIAHLLDEKDRLDLADEAPSQALTLAYASPEQIQGEGLSAATDVYSLGVLLYKLLTDTLPFDHIQNAQSLPAAILAGEITPPAGISADLKAIVMKALSVDAEQRYVSVKDLADDLQRFLEHRPVRARSNHPVYRSRRFAWRHRWALAVVTGLAMLLVTFFIDREAQLQRIAWERDRAEAVTEFMNELFAGADSLPSRGNEVTVREILDLGTAQLTSADDLNPAMLGSINLAIGRAYNALGLGEQALPLLEEAQAALAPSSRLSEKARIQAEIGAALDSGGRAVEAIDADQRAIEMLESAPDDYSDEILRLRIRKLRNHANVLDVPLAQIIEELNGIVDHLGARPDQSLELMFEAQSALVGAYVFQGEAQQALQTAVSARSLADELYQPGDPRRLRGRFAYATALMLSDPEGAVEMYAALIQDHERLIGPSQRLANTIGNYGVALSRLGRNQESMEAFAEAARMIETVVGRDHYLYRLSMSNLAALHLRQDDPVQAEVLIRDILADQQRRIEQFGGVEAVYRASALDILGSALTLQGRLEEAAEIYTEALRLLESEGTGSWPSLESALAAKLAEVEREIAATKARD